MYEILDSRETLLIFLDNYLSFNYLFSREVNTSLDHLFSILSLRTFVNWFSWLFSNVKWDFIFGVETNWLVKCHWQFVLVIQLMIHSLMLISVLFHLIETLIFLCSLCFTINLLLQSYHCLSKLIPRDLSILVHIKFLHKH